MTVIQWLDWFRIQHPAYFALSTLAVGAIVTHLWHRFRNRSVSLVWTATHHPHAVSSHFEQVGKIQVLVDGEEARCLFLTTVELRNPTVTDIQNIEVEFSLPVGTTIIACEGGIAAQVRKFDWGQSCIADFAREREIRDANTPELNTLRDKLGRWRTFLIPAFNRQSVATFYFLWENASDANQRIDVSVAHLGVKLAFRSIPQFTILGIDNRHAALTGIVLATIVGLIWFQEIQDWIILAIGVSSALTGAVVVKVWQSVVRMMS